MHSNLRSIENNRYIFRLETSGFSTVIDNLGNNLKSVPINNEEILYFEVPLINKKTLYSKYNYFIELIIILLGVFIILYSLI